MELGKEIITMLPLHDAAALGWFAFCWIGYTYYSKYQETRKLCLAGILRHHRVAWMTHMLTRDVRVADAALLANLERNVTFFASTTMLIIAGILTLFGSSEKLAAFPLINPALQEFWNIKMTVILAIFVYAFFKFTWSLRQYGFANIMIGSAPHGTAKKQFAKETALVISRAGQAFNLGLRSYYFSLAFAAWFINWWAFIVATTLVVAVLYRREFKSRVLRALLRSADDSVKELFK